MYSNPGSSDTVLSELITRLIRHTVLTLCGSEFRDQDLQLNSSSYTLK